MACSFCPQRGSTKQKRLSKRRPVSGCSMGSHKRKCHDVSLTCALHQPKFADENYWFCIEMCTTTFSLSLSFFSAILAVAFKTEVGPLFLGAI